MAKQIDIAPELLAAKGKIYAPKGASGSAADRRFKVVEVIPSFDFGPKRGGRRPAFEVHRLDKDAAHTPPAEEFLAEHDEVPE
jgi:hypothetical protein